MKQNLKIGFLGLGVVGTALMELICNNKSQLEERYNINIQFGKVLVRDLNKKRNIDLSGIELTCDGTDIVDDINTRIVIDCMGGSGDDKTYNLILRAIENGKAVIMSSKKCLAKNGLELIQAVVKKQVFLGFDATVGGCIPITHLFRNCLNGERVIEISGLLNATSNFILSKMQEDDITYEEALGLAKRLGYAENDSTDDVDNFDAMFKLIILSGMGMKKWINYKNIKHFSIQNISTCDFLYGNNNGLSLKSFAICKENDGEIQYYIGPAFVSKQSLVDKVYGNNNIIFVNSTWAGRRALIGQGAGSKPTAATMYDDLVCWIKSNYRDSFVDLKKICEYNEIKEIETNYYVRTEEEKNIEEWEKIFGVECLNIGDDEKWRTVNQLIIKNVTHSYIEEKISEIMYVAFPIV